MQNNHGKVVHIMSPLCCCQVEMEKLRMEEGATSAARQKEQLGQIIHNLEQELAEGQDEVQTLQVRGHQGWGKGHSVWIGQMIWNRPLQI